MESSLLLNLNVAGSPSDAFTRVLGDDLKLVVGLLEDYVVVGERFLGPPALTNGAQPRSCTDGWLRSARKPMILFAHRSRRLTQMKKFSSMRE